MERRIGAAMGRTGAAARRAGRRRGLCASLARWFIAHLGAASAPSQCPRETASKLACRPIFLAAAYERLRNSGLAPGRSAKKLSDAACAVLPRASRAAAPSSLATGRSQDSRAGVEWSRSSINQRGSNGRARNSAASCGMPTAGIPTAVGFCNSRGPPWEASPQ